jgi:hypothetical protein
MLRHAMTAVQRELQTATKRRSVDCGDGGNSEICEFRENSMAFLGELKCVAEVTWVGESVEVRTRTKRSSVARHDERCEIGRSRCTIVERLSESSETKWPEGRWTTIVVVGQRQYSDRLSARAECLGELGEYWGILYWVVDHARKLGFSQIIVPPWPRPTHIVVMP